MGQNKRFRQDNDEPSDDLISRQLQDGLPKVLVPLFPSK